MACTKREHVAKRLSELERGDAICLTGQRNVVVRRVQNINDAILRITYSQKGLTKHWTATRDGIVQVHVATPG